MCVCLLACGGRRGEKKKEKRTTKKLTLLHAKAWEKAMYLPLIF